MKVYVVAVNQLEADTIYKSGFFHGTTRKEAEKAKEDICAPPTDPYYASLYKVFEVEAIK